LPVRYAPFVSFVSFVVKSSLEDIRTMAQAIPLSLSGLNLFENQ
jgi:hypothetical protein